ncbi:Tfp pilus assembly protein PilO [Desulfomicrobium macestii]|uniref:Tfp pilus assembly protein PilO n=2 Tax=Desulfomicrobium macestii TaxID=90731 RepID=A0ABR9H6S2_9BACT|nr:Tfp pilus assembly protein PilO [Desulfomicrobium macestii]
MSMKKLSQFEKYGIMAAIIIACTFFYMKKVYEPQEKEFKKTVAALNKVVGEVNGLKQIPPLIQVKHELENAKKDLEEVNKRLKGTLMHTGEAREVTHMLRQINEHVAASGLKVVSLTPGGRKSDTLLQLEWNLFQLSLSGSFHGFLQLLESLRNMPDAIRVDEVALTAGNGEFLEITFNLMI